MSSNSRKNSQSNGESVSIVDSDEMIAGDEHQELLKEKEKAPKVENPQEQPEGQTKTAPDDAEEEEHFSMSTSISDSQSESGEAAQKLEGDAEHEDQKLDEDQEALLATGESEEEDEEGQRPLISEEEGGVEGEEDAAAEPAETTEQVLIAAETRGRAISRLVMFSVILITVPLCAMYLTYRFIFTDIYHLPRDQAVLYGGLVAAVFVYVILGIFAWLAYHDEQKYAKQVEESKKVE